MDFWVKAGQLILSLSILIVLHELGHFIPARIFKTRVEKFYLFFNPWFSLFKVKKGETEWGIGWLPLGGYVKIAGMIDESMDKEQMNKPAEPWEFRAKPAWQRLIIMIGGVTVNLILGFIIYIFILFTWGKDQLPLSEMKYGIECDSLAMDYGFQNGDKILTIEGEVPEDFMSINREILLNDAREVVVERNGGEKMITLPDDIVYEMIDKGAKGLFFAPIPAVIDSLIAGEPAEKAGFKIGDSIVAVNGKSTYFFTDVAKSINNEKEKEITVDVVRGNELVTLTVTTTKDGTIGIAPKKPKDIYKFKHIEYGFFAAIPAGITDGAQTLRDYVFSLRFLFSSAGAKSIGGFGSIGGLFPSSWDWHQFWKLTAFISIILAFMNLLPIPALDGGHVLFLLIEMIRGKAPSQRVMEVAQMIGMIFLLALLLYANGNDIVKLFN